MSFTIRTTPNASEAAEFIVTSILNQLKIDKKVLFFVTGGSSIDVAVKVAELLLYSPHQKLTIMMTDERFGPVDYAESNWHQMLQKGFKLPNSKLLPILTGKDFETTIREFNTDLARELADAEYKIALFGVGKDGHTAGMLPGSVAVSSSDLACGYQAPPYSRITITPKVVEQLNEAVVFMQGTEKWPVVENLEKDIDVALQPVQILKKVPLLTIFTDYKKP